MKKESSNATMETTFNVLSNIKKVDAPEALYDKVLSKIYEKQETISLSLVKIAATVLLFVFSTEAITVVRHIKPNESNTITELVSATNNSLYNE